MPQTSASLFDRLQTESDPTSWRRLVDIYTPMIRKWLHPYALRREHVEDITQDVMARLVLKLPEFQKSNRTGSFRCWLRHITVNCLRESWRKQRFQPGTGGSNFAEILQQFEDPHSSLSRVWDREHDQHVIRCLLARLKPRFETRTWQAFQRVALDGAPADQVAHELQLSVNAVFIAKSRVLHALRREGQGLLEDADE